MVVISVVVSTVMVMVAFVVMSMTRPEVQPRHENLQIYRKQQKQHEIQKNTCRIQLAIQQLQYVRQKYLSIATNEKDVYLRQ